jgi:pimeloyl-ACP methyl ester carboxylesterase
MKLKFSLIYIFLSFWFASFSQDLIGDWYGFLENNGTKIKIVFHIEKKGGILTGSVDSPDQGVYGLKLNFVSKKENKVLFDMSSFGIKYEGTQKSKDSIFGNFIQGNYISELVLKKSEIEISKAPNRPQDPKGPFFYRQTEVSFTNSVDQVTLSGTLTMPRGKGPFPAVVLVSGSGPQNRNSEIFSHKPFWVISDFLTRNGFAVLRYDDRGVGKSTGNFETATTSNFAYDTQAAFNFLKNSPKINKNKVGIIGHSEGGMVAPMVAAADTQVRFIVLLAGPGIPISQLMLKQTELSARFAGVSEEEILISQELNKKFYDILLTNKDVDVIKTKIETIVNSHVKSMSDEVAKEILAELPVITQTMTSPWFRYFINFNPEHYLKQINCPVLALNGTKDCQVSAIENLQGIRNSVKETNNQNVYTYLMPDLNHLFQTCETGSVDEYAKLEETFSLEVLEIIRDWIKKTKFK